MDDITSVESKEELEKVKISSLGKIESFNLSKAIASELKQPSIDLDTYIRELEEHGNQEKAIINTQDSTDEEKDRFNKKIDQLTKEGITEIRALQGESKDTLRAKVNAIKENMSKHQPTEKGQVIGYVESKARELREAFLEDKTLSANDRKEKEEKINAILKKAFDKISEAKRTSQLEVAKKEAELSLNAIKSTKKIDSPRLDIQKQVNELDKVEQESIKVIDRDIQATEEEKVEMKKYLAEEKAKGIEALKLVRSNKAGELEKVKADILAKMKKYYKAEKKEAITDALMKLADKQKEVLRKRKELSQDKINYIDESLDKSLLEITTAKTNSQVEDVLAKLKNSFSALVPGGQDDKEDLEEIKAQAQEVVDKMAGDYIADISLNNRLSEGEKEYLREQVERMQSAVREDIAKAQDKATVNEIKERALSFLKTRKFVGTEKATTEINSAYEKKLKEINENTRMSDDEKIKAKESVTKVATTAREDIDLAKDDNAVDEAKNKGLEAIASIRMIGKDKVLAEISSQIKSKQDAVRSIEGVSKEEKARVIDEIYKSYFEARKMIEEAETQDKVDVFGN